MESGIMAMVMAINHLCALYFTSPLALALTHTARIVLALFDICDHDIPLPKCDIVIAADIMYEPKTGIAMAQRTVEALNAGSRVIIGCSPGRPGRPKFQEALEKLLPGRDTKFIEVAGKTCMGPRNDLICGKGSTSVSSTPKSLSVKLLDLRPI